MNGNITTATRRFDGDRAAVRQQTLAWACARLNALLQTPACTPLIQRKVIQTNTGAHN